jgi:hypothetical protein
MEIFAPGLTRHPKIIAEAAAVENPFTRTMRWLSIRLRCQLLIFRRQLDVIDEDNLHLGSLRFQFQPELLMEQSAGSEDSVVAQRLLFAAAARRKRGESSKILRKGMVDKLVVHIRPRSCCISVSSSNDEATGFDPGQLHQNIYSCLNALMGSTRAARLAGM